MTRPVAGIGDAVLTGHLCTPVTPIVEGIPNVLALGRPVSVLGSALAPHTIKLGKKCKPHVAITYTTGSTVLVGGVPINKIGDPADYGKIITGTSKVLAV